MEDRTVEFTVNDVVEIKVPGPHRNVTEDLSEFERARSMSKTWSMEQD